MKRSNKHKFSDYGKPSITVDNLIFTINEIANDDIRKLDKKKLQLLLIKREESPYESTWCLPGVFMQIGETLEEAYIRALRDKASIVNSYLEQLYTFDDIERDPRDRIVSVAYMGLVSKDSIKILNKNSDSISWFNIDVVNSGKKVCLKFDNEAGVKFEVNLKLDSDSNINVVNSDSIGFDHAKIIYYGLTRLRNKIEYTDIAFNMLPKEFTFAELQQVYEVILDKKFTKANFQRKTKDRLKPLNKYRPGGFRPARLYAYAGA